MVTGMGTSNGLEECSTALVHVRQKCNLRDHFCIIEMSNVEFPWYQLLIIYYLDMFHDTMCSSDEPL